MPKIGGAALETAAHRGQWGSGDCRPPPRAWHPSQLSISLLTCTRGLPSSVLPWSRLPSAHLSCSQWDLDRQQAQGREGPRGCEGCRAGPSSKGKSRGSGRGGDTSPANALSSPVAHPDPTPRHLLMRQQEPRVR